MSALPLFILTKSEEGPDFCICIISVTWFFLGRCEHLFPQVGCQWMMDQWNHSTQVPPSVAVICWGHLQRTGKECIHALSMDDSKAAASLKMPWQHTPQVTKAATPELPDNLLATHQILFSTAMVTVMEPCRGALWIPWVSGTSWLL